MNNQQESVMYQKDYCGPPNTLGPIYAAEQAVRKQSECEAAYQMLHKAQDELSGMIGDLHSRLGPVLSGNTAEADNGPTQAPQSEVHGWLIAAEMRTYALTRRIRAITESLTI